MRILLVLLILATLSSCYPEWRLARSYIKENPEISVFIIPTYNVYKTNLKDFEITGRRTMTDADLEEALMEQSVFLNEISDSIFLETFTNSLITEFERLGFIVYPESYLNDFLKRGSPGIIFNIAQVELEEHYVLHEDEEQYGDLIYYKTFDLNAVTCNFWFELSLLNDHHEPTQLFFATETLSDQIHGYFTENLLTGNVNYRYHIRELDVDIIYSYTNFLGQRYAGYTFDYLMNLYIASQKSSGKESRYYMHYKRWNNSLAPTLHDRFIMMDD